MSGTSKWKTAGAEQTTNEQILSSRSPAGASICLGPLRWTGPTKETKCPGAHAREAGATLPAGKRCYRKEAVWDRCWGRRKVEPMALTSPPLPHLQLYLLLAVLRDWVTPSKIQMFKS